MNKYIVIAAIAFCLAYPILLLVIAVIFVMHKLNEHQKELKADHQALGKRENR